MLSVHSPCHPLPCNGMGVPVELPLMEPMARTQRKLDQKLFLLAHDSATQKWVFPWVERAAEAEPTVRSVCAPIHLGDRTPCESRSCWLHLSCCTQTVEEFLQIMDPNGQFYPVGNCPIAHIPSQVVLSLPFFCGSFGFRHIWHEEWEMKWSF